MLRFRRLALIFGAAAAAIAVALIAALVFAKPRGDAATARDGTLAISAYEYGFKPNRIAADAGRTRIEIRNSGRRYHNFELRRADRKVVKIDSWLPGETKTVTLSLHPGTYTILDSRPGNRELGMWGEISVRGVEGVEGEGSNQ